MLEKLLARFKGNPKPTASSDVLVCGDGIRCLLQSSSDRTFRWIEVLEVRIIWSENLWGDPQWGRYCDTEWMIRSTSGHGFTIPDEEQNRAILIPAFSKHLQDFKFDYDAFDQAHRSRVFEFSGGTYVVWSRPVEVSAT